MLTKTKWVASGIAAAAVLAVGTGLGVASSDDGKGAPITGTALAKASSIALERTGGTRVTQTEVRDEQGYYEVEVVLEDGSLVDVYLDRGFNVIPGVGEPGREDSENGAHDE